ncbi:hypothetical protein D3P07_07845 [Paenibacillus sp. 1011MAR3C5]|uniref:hypothetical protein n=1 Tax=Paenibacillus sp. 1011MAR3C5 TaxID=1675787 RepID=UPI000E6C00AE|nr:hypothetical protein [Paenibacillus sp. 1011MAR3C5]RJE90120.1 hypothetical protein D3P07_07845 [Paenibacillus sp. 1011MAR3C5]
MIHMECECGNRTNLFATGDRDEHGREFIELEDDDRFSFVIGEDSIVFKCSFCGYRYRLKHYE